jgi:hypothetical protein
MGFRRVARDLLAAAWAIALVIAPATARAEAAPAAAAAEPEAAASASAQADAAFQAGLRSARAGRFEEARAAFATAYAASPDGATLWNLAIAEMKSDHPALALRHLRQYLRGANVDPAYTARAPRILEQLTAKTARIQIVAPPGTSLTIDGEKLETPLRTGESLDVLPREHVIEGSLGERVAHMRVTPAAGEDVVVTLLEDTAPAEAEEVAAATATTTAAGVGGPPESLAAPNPATASPAAPERPRTFLGPARIVAVGLAAGAVASAGVGVAFGANSRDEAGHAAALRAANGPSGCLSPSAACIDQREAVAAQNRNAIVERALYAGAGALLVSAAVLWFWPDGRGARSAVTPAVGPGVAAVEYALRF